MSRQRAGAAERGFVLVGVVMMVLALTIIGLSLYSLSGYESSFFGRTYAERMSVYRAAGGIELVKRLITTPLGSNGTYVLSSARLAVGREGIVSAVAWQDEVPPDSSGSVDWSKDVHIRVGVDVYGSTRTVEGAFTPTEPNNPYWRLFAATSSIGFESGSPTGTIRAVGGAWQLIRSASDSSWISKLESESSVALTATACPAPSVTPYILAHIPGPLDSAVCTRPDYVLTSQPPYYSYGTTVVSMDASGAPGGYKYFWAATDTLSIDKGGLPYFDYYSSANVRVKVSGTAIWIIPRGAYFVGEFSVERLPNANTANLVIVAGPNGRYSSDPVAGMWFTKGIATPENDVNVFVVTNGSARIEDGTQTSENLEARYLSVSAPSILLRGRPAGGHILDLEYRPALRLVADDLYGRGLLPDVPGMVSTAFTMNAGSWRETPGLQ